MAALELTQQGDTATLQEHQRALLLLLREFDRVCKKLEISYCLFAGTLLGAVRHGGIIPWDDDLDVIMLREDYERFLRQAPQELDCGMFLQREFSEHWPMFFSKLRLEGTTCLEKYKPRDPLIHQGVYMDIFPCDNAYGSALLRKLQFLASKVVIAKGLDREGYVTDSKKKKCFMAVCRILPNRPFLRFVKGPKKMGEQLHSFLGGASKYSRSVYPAAAFGETRTVGFDGLEVLAPQDPDRLLRILYGDYMRIPPPEERKCKQHAILVDLTRSYEHYAHYRDDMTFDVHTRSIR
ncbi:MAG: LicD family protein [Oscillospiraceae bacterium]|nr:LicD family protein [Oscillospiraceae bacterium]